MKKPAATTKPTKPAKKSSKKSYPIPKCCPYRKTSQYALVFAVLFSHRQKGISRQQLLQKVVAASNRPEKNCRFNIAVVVSPTEDGKAHPSANKAANHYFIERINGWVKLHLREQS